MPPVLSYLGLTLGMEIREENTLTEKRKGALGDHEKRGGKFVPQMAKLPINIQDGLRDAAPDFIWPSMAWVEGGESMLRGFVDLQRAVLGADETADHTNRPRFDGKLSTLETWTEEERAEFGPALVAQIDAKALLPDTTLFLLRQYPNVPGAWLLLDPWAGVDLDPSFLEESLQVAAQAIAEWGKGGHLNALTKYLTFCWAALAGGMTWDPEFGDYLKDFPVAVAKREKAGTMIRAGYSAHEGARLQDDETVRDISTAWAKDFWRTNWKLTGCLLPHEESDTGSNTGDSTDGTIYPEAAGQNTAVDALLEKVLSEYDRLMDAYLGAEGRDLFDPLGDEVVAGLTLRAITGTASLVRAPHQWSSQFASVALRQIAETEIVLAWLAAHPEDFAKYRDYGDGHEKLAWLHVGDILDEIGKLPPELDRVSAKLEERKRSAYPLDVTVVSVESTFTGISVRRMAGEVGLAALYRSVYQVASGEVHGEWEPVRRENLVRCRNPLHRFHYLPSPRPPWVHQPALVEVIVKMLGRLVGIGVEMLGGEAAA